MYKDNHTYSDQVIEYENITRKYPDRIPIICETDPNDKTLELLKHTKYLIPKSLTIGQFIHVIRKKLHIPSDKAIYLLVGERVIPPTSASLHIIYDKYREKSGLLFMLVCSESFFG